MTIQSNKPKFISCYSYPRSGKQWTLLRVQLFLLKALNILPSGKEHLSKSYIIEPNFGTKITNNHIRFEHLNFHSTGSPINPNQSFQYHLHNTQPVVYFILRDAKAVLSSAYYHALGIEWKGKSRMDIDEYVCGEYGVEKYCSFLNAINDVFLNERDCRMVHYEDMFNKKWIKKHIPSISNLPEYKMSRDELEYIHYYSSIKGLAALEGYKVESIKHGNNTAEGIRFAETKSYKKEISKQSQEKIDSFLKQYCRLEAYLNYYLKD